MRFIDVKIDNVNVKYLSPDGSMSAAVYERIVKQIKKLKRGEPLKAYERYWKK